MDTLIDKVLKLRTIWHVIARERSLATEAISRLQGDCHVGLRPPRSDSLCGFYLTALAAACPQYSVF